MAPVLDVNNSNNWELIYNTTLSANILSVSPPLIVPIGTHNVPVTSDRRTLAVGASTTQGKPTWRLGYYLISSIQIPVIGRADISSDAIFLGLNLIRLPNVHNEYKFKIRVPRWMRDMQIDIYKYVGEELDS